MAMNVLLSRVDAHGTSIRIAEEEKDWFRRLRFKIEGFSIKKKSKRKDVYNLLIKTPHELEDLTVGLEKFLGDKRDTTDTRLGPHGKVGPTFTKNLDVLQDGIGLLLPQRYRSPREREIIPIELDLAKEALDCMKAYK